MSEFRKDWIITSVSTEAESSIKTLCGMIFQTGCLIPMGSVMVDLR